MDDPEKLYFVPEAKGSAAKEVTIKLDPYAAAPAKVEGTYTAGDKTTPFTLTKSKGK